MISVVTQSLILAIMAIGVYITFKILDFPDMTADGSYTMGAAISAAALAGGLNPLVGVLLAVVGGALAGMVTGLLHIKVKISNLLSGILTMGMLYSINLRIMGKSNIPLFTFPNLFKGDIPPVVIALIFVLIAKILLDLFLKTGLGYTLKGVGDNEQMIKSLGINIGNIKILGLMISNALISLSGALMAQFQGFADVTMGIGTLVLGIASIIIGLTLFKKIRAVKATTAILIGAFIYQFTIYFALNLGMLSTDLKLISSLVIVAFLAVGNLQLKKKTAKE
ncbi:MULTISPECIES: ABC transporter permease [Peptostreptococcales]|uniref:ABC transporter permease n=1 Tax=Peptostreptococcales TaxID=3082720 RepID=UPI000E4F93D6|nr:MULTISPECIES: ABC transporter permease [Peptostreptococcaceae]MEE0248470.1 ABC transporter permease [Peptacetobacter hiranonis]QQQ87231.1 ABC transporter permease [Peptacetobacter hiranonis]RHQ99325.1 ABC transporter permease [Peptoclostridium sp. AF21-18]